MCIEYCKKARIGVYMACVQYIMLYLSVENVKNLAQTLIVARLLGYGVAWLVGILPNIIYNIV